MAADARLTPRQLNRATLARQMLLARERVPIVEAVRRVVAIQAQSPASPYVALWNRVERFDPAELDAAFASHAVVRATLVRITLHAVLAEDYTAFHEAMLPNLRASRLHDRRFKDTGRTISEVDALVPELLAFAAEPRTVPEIEAFLTDHLGAPPERVWWALRTFTAMTHAPTGGPWTFGPRSFRAGPTHPPRPEPDAALRHLLRRYLEGFGPATAQDFATFAMQRQPGVKAALASMKDELVTFEGPGRAPLHDLRDAPVPPEDTPAPPRLMAMWDSTLLAYADRSRVIPDEHRPHVIRRNGDVLATVLVDGLVAGVWRMVDAGIEVTTFARIDDEAWEGLAAEAASLLDMAEGRDPALYRRHDHWWASLPATEVTLLST